MHSCTIHTWLYCINVHTMCDRYGIVNCGTYVYTLDQIPVPMVQMYNHDHNTQRIQKDREVVMQGELYT